MKHSGWNPTRRNRNIGTKKSGQSQNNKFVVPERWADYRIYWERLRNPVIVPVDIKGHTITMLVEATKRGYVHASTPEDIFTVLELVAQDHLEEVSLIVLRQPKKKEEILHPVWGRFVYYADLGRYSGPAIYLEAVKREAIVKWGKKLDPYEQKELQALEADGHRIVQTKRGYNIHTKPDTVRNTQLYRTLAHEIGHAVDFLYNSLRPSIEAGSEANSDYINNVYNAKPTLDKEEYAHRYSREFFQKWAKAGYLPFERKFNPRSLECAGLNITWFHY